LITSKTKKGGVAKSGILPTTEEPQLKHVEAARFKSDRIVAIGDWFSAFISH
jgi:hypothetical protein